MKSPIYIALVHYPIQNKQGDIVTTSITNFDLHDLGRTSKTFGVEKYFVVTPQKSQQGMALFIKQYWNEGTGSVYNPSRKEALELLEVASSLEEVKLTIQNQHNKKPLLFGTTAKKSKDSLTYEGVRKKLETEDTPILLAFGTGWGMPASLMATFDGVLEPILGPGDYNHLPVRSAVAIILDRLCGNRGNI